MKWSVGDKVMAKWPGSALYFHAEIKIINEDDTAEVLFSDGTEMEVPISYIQSEAVFAHPKRAKSPARYRRRSRSPARSPSRKKQVSKKGTNETPKVRRRSRSNSRSQNKLLSSSSSSEEKTTTSKSVGNLTTEKVVTSTKLTKSMVTISSEDLTATDSPRMMSRHREKAKKLSPSVTLESSIIKQRTSPESLPFEYGGPLGVFVIYISTPFLPLVMLTGCTKHNCSISEFNPSMFPSEWQAYFSIRSFLIVLAFMLFQAIIYALPFGRIISGPPTPYGNRLDYRISAMYTLLITGVAYFVPVFRYKLSFASIHDELLQLAVAGTVLSYLGTFLVHIASFWAEGNDINPAANTGSHLYDSFLGRYFHPRFGRLFDLKLYLYRPAMAGWLVMIWIEMGRDYDLHGQHSTCFLIVAISQILYIFFEFFYDESQCPYMLDIKNEGLGFVQFFGEIVIVPFVYSVPVRYVIDFPSDLSPPQLVVTAILLLTGFFLVVWSGRQKSMFRKNPFDPRLQNLESMPPSKVNGSRLIVSGLWGFLRHPNYLGEILIGSAWSVACGFTHVLPWFYPVFVTVLLCHRSLRDDVRCRQKHGLAWKMYCDRVKYRVIPGVF